MEKIFYYQPKIFEIQLFHLLQKNKNLSKIFK
jgi:hypothetical protein